MTTIGAVLLLLVCVPIAAVGVAFFFNVGGIGVRYVVWYRENWARTQGLASLRTPRGTRLVAGVGGLVWLVGDSGIAVLVFHALLK